MRRAFTLIELLVVVAIIGVLLALLLPVIANVRLKARLALTTNRIEDALRSLTRVGGEEGSAAFVLQKRLALGGVLTARYHSGNKRMQVLAGSPLDVTQPWNLGFPWSGRNLLGSADPDVLPAPDEAWSSVTPGDLSLARSGELMALVGVLPPDDPGTPTDEAVAAYQQDRGGNRAWNDAWGNPLLMAYGFFQPEIIAPDCTPLDQATTTYQYNRAVYVCAGAAGPRPAAVATAATWSTGIAQQWAQIADVCQPTAADRWTGKAWTQPPWQGVRVQRRGGEWCLLSAPAEYK